MNAPILPVKTKKSTGLCPADFALTRIQTVPKMSNKQPTPGPKNIGDTSYDRLLEHHFIILHVNGHVAAFFIFLRQQLH